MTTIRSATPAQWHKVRSQGIGASEIAAALGCSRYETPRQLWSRKAGLPHVEREVHDRMRWGNVLEPIAAAWLSHAWGVAVRCPEPFSVEVHPEHAWMRATLDARIRVDGASHCDAPHGEYVVDFKLISAWDDAWKGANSPDDYLAQIGQQMLVTGTPRGLLVAIPFADRIDMKGATASDWEVLAGFVRNLSTTFTAEQALAILGCGEPIVRRFDADPRLDAAIITHGGAFWRNVCAARAILAEHGGNANDECWEALRPLEPAAQPGDFDDMRAQFRSPRAEALEVEPEYAAAIRAAKANAKRFEAEYEQARATAMQQLGNLSRMECRGEVVATFNEGKRGRTLLVK